MIEVTKTGHVVMSNQQTTIVFQPWDKVYAVTDADGEVLFRTKDHVDALDYQNDLNSMQDGINYLFGSKS